MVTAIYLVISDANSNGIYQKMLGKSINTSFHLAERQLRKFIRPSPVTIIKRRISLYYFKRN